jgi:hypothetical protein
MYSRTLAAIALLPILAGCGPDAAWNCDVGTERCHDGVLQVCVLDHADTTPDGTITEYIGRWLDKGACP